MAKRLDKIVVVDVESTCWENAPPYDEVSEIIEVGVCLLDMQGVVDWVQSPQGILVRPQHSRVSDYCTSLTTLTQGQLEMEGISFSAACQKLTLPPYLSRQRVWASYGDYDRRQFERTCQLYTIPYPFGPTHLNVKALFALRRGLSREVGLVEALAMSGFFFVGTHHRGVDDAQNVARLLATLVTP